jgi:sensor histidine kinase YesM
MAGKLLALGLVVLMFWWIYMVAASNALESYRDMVKQVAQWAPRPLDGIVWLLLFLAAVFLPFLVLFYCTMWFLLRKQRKKAIAAMRAGSENANRDIAKMIDETLAHERKSLNLTDEETAALRQSIEEVRAEVARESEAKIARYRDNPQLMEAELKSTLESIQQKARQSRAK